MNRILSITLLLIITGLSQDSFSQTGTPALEQVFTDSLYQLTGVAVSREGRLFTNYPLWSDLHKYAVVEVNAGQKVSPYPYPVTNSWQPGDSGVNKWVCVQAVYVDPKNELWVVDPASPKQKGVYMNSQKLVRISLSSNTVERIYSLAGVTDDKSYINDVRVDTVAQIAYLTNSGEGGIIVVNLNSGSARQVLKGSASVQPDPAYRFTIDGEIVKKNGQPFKGNSDGIALSPDGKYLYYKPLTDDKLYRVLTKYLRDSALAASDLVSKVEDLGHFTTTDGMIFDGQGNLYLGDLEKHRIVRIDPALKMSVLVQDDRLIWPDSYQITSDGYLYVSCSQINKQPDFNNGVNKRTTPYAIYKTRIRLPDLKPQKSSP